MKLSADAFVFKQCTMEDLDRILEIQDQIFYHLASPELLRKNDPDMLRECLESPNITLGAWYQNRLVAFSVLYFPKDETECLATGLEGVNVDGLFDANYKLCIVDQAFWGNSLQYEMGVRLLQYAAQRGVRILCATASPENPYSIANIEKMGFSYNCSLSKYGFQRNLYYKML